MAVAQDVKAELRRLVLARSDIEWAAALLDEAARETQSNRGWRLWEAAANAYGRPFKKARLGLGHEWSEFPNDDLARIHRELIGLRDKVFAHNDRTRYRQVVLVPPDSVREVRQGSLFATRQKVLAPKKLINFQLDRLGRRIADLTKQLTYGQPWRDGEELDLAQIDDKLELIEPASPFQVPLRARHVPE